MRNRYVFLLGAVVFIFLSGCAKRSVSEKDLLDFIKQKDNGLRKVRSIGDLTITVSYQPGSLMALRELKTQGKLNDSIVAAFESNYNDYWYCQLSLSKAGKEILWSSTSQTYSAVLNTMQFGMVDYVMLTTDSGDTLTVEDYVYSQSYGISGSSDMLFAFSKAKESVNYYELTLYDFGLGVGTTKYRFLASDIQSLPSIDYTTIQRSL